MSEEVSPEIVVGPEGDLASALELLALGWPEPERVLQRQLVEGLLNGPERETMVLARAYDRGQLAGVALAQRLAGRVAALFPPQLAGGVPEEISGRLLRAVEAKLRAADVQLAQALLGLEQPLERSRLLAAGYLEVATLLYMMSDRPPSACTAGAASAGPPNPDDRRNADSSPPALQIVAPDDESRLARVIQATYEGTLDCPLLNGMRSTADVLAGYRAVGTFRPELWLLARTQDRDVGCLILADHPEQEQFELVYLGLIPQVRSRGWGGALVRHALVLAEQLARQRIVLAVDAKNAPAIAAYEGAGFFGWDRRRVLVKRL